MFHYWNPKLLNLEIQRCGYTFSASSYVKYLLAVYLGIAGFAYLFQLQVFFSVIVMAAASIFVPTVFLMNYKNLYEVLDLGFGKCKMAVAGPKEMKDRIDKQNIMRVASKYPRIAREYFHKVKGQTVDIIKLNGSVELGPLVGLSDVIVDIVESGKTLKENGLDVLEEICDLSARLVVNRVSMKLKRDKIVDIIQKMKGEINC